MCAKGGKSLDLAGTLVIVSGLPRSVYRCEPRAGLSGRPLPPDVSLRLVDKCQDTDNGDAALGRLMERAYTGTIDEDLGDNSDGAVEIADWRAYGAIASASVVAIDSDSHVIAASLVARAADGSAWIGYVFTDPAWKGRGLGTAVVAASLGVLAQQRCTAVFAGVTDGNTPSERLLTSLGFVRAGPV